MYKVGDRVWIKDMKEFGTIQEIKGDDCHSDLKNGIDFSHFDNIHQTADSMFEELGYEKKSNVKGILLTYRNNADIIIDFDLIEKSYAVYYYEGDNLIYTEINTQLHLAIHQKLIELGWIE